LAALVLLFAAAPFAYLHEPPDSPVSAAQQTMQLAPDHAGANSAVPAQSPVAPGDCAIEDGLFSSTEGGCKDLSTGLVWSAFTAPFPYPGNVFTWEEAGEYCDCLVEGGYDDWFLPSKDDLITVALNGAGTHFTWSGDDNPTGWVEWSSDSVGQRAWAVNVAGGGSASKELKASIIPVLCARLGNPPPPPPAPIVNSVAPAGMTAGDTISMDVLGADFAAGAMLAFENGFLDQRRAPRPGRWPEPGAESKPRIRGYEPDTPGLDASIHITGSRARSRC